MRFLLGNISLANLSGGTLNNGVVPWPRVLRQRAKGNNAGSVTVTNATTTIVSQSLTGALLGDFIEVQVGLNCSLGGTSTAPTFTVAKTAGTGTVQYCGSATLPSTGDVGPSSGGANPILWYGSFVFDVTVAGTFTFTLQGSVQTANGTVAPGLGQLDCQLIAGS